MLPLDIAAIASMLGGYMLLPAGLSVDVPLVPPIDKLTICSITVLLLCWMKGTPEAAPRGSVLMRLLAILFVVSPLITSLNNSYELHIANLSIPGMYPVDGLKTAIRNAILLLPLYIGSRYLSSELARRHLLQSFAVMLLFYSAPMLFELRMSPQLHRWIYGYFPHEFIQQVRDGGYRPVVFIGHGLALAFITCISFLSAVILTRAKIRVARLPAIGVSLYLLAILLLCKSLGPVIYAMSFGALIIFVGPRAWVKVALILCVTVLIYPAVRSAGLSPVKSISQLANRISHDRAASFDYRVENEDALLKKANEKPLLGWGTWGRNEVYDAESGKETSVTDGGWIIQYGVYGWLGYISLFGLLTAAVLRAHKSIPDAPRPVAAIVLGGLTLLLGAYVIDQVPNANPLSFIFLIAGSIAARRSSMRAQESGVIFDSASPKAKQYAGSLAA